VPSFQHSCPALHSRGCRSTKYQNPALHARFIDRRNIFFRRPCRFTFNRKRCVSEAGWKVKRGWERDPEAKSPNRGSALDWWCRLHEHKVVRLRGNITVTSTRAHSGLWNVANKVYHRTPARPPAPPPPPSTSVLTVGLRFRCLAGNPTLILAIAYRPRASTFEYGFTAWRNNSRPLLRAYTHPNGETRFRLYSVVPIYSTFSDAPRNKMSPIRTTTLPPYTWANITSRNNKQASLGGSPLFLTTIQWWWWTK